MVYFLQFATYTPYKRDQFVFGGYSLAGFLRYVGNHWLLYTAWLLVILLVLVGAAGYLRALLRRRPQDPETTAANEAPAIRRFVASGAVFTALNIGLTLY